MKLEAGAPATLGAVVEAVTRLSIHSEAEILELVSAGRLRELFPFRSNRADELPRDTEAEEDLVEASPMPLSRKGQAALIESSMPPSSATRRGSAARGRRRPVSKS